MILKIIMIDLNEKEKLYALGFQINDKMEYNMTHRCRL